MSLKRNHLRPKEIASKLTDQIIPPLTILSMNYSRIKLKHRKNPDLRVSDIRPLLDKIEENIFRIKDAAYALAELIRNVER